jgi:hypothetical protein
VVLRLKYTIISLKINPIKKWKKETKLKCVINGSSSLNLNFAI